MPNNEPIHSGHFMTSNPHTEILVEDEDEDVEVDVVDVDEPEVPLIEKRSLQERVNKVYSLQQDEKPVTFYKFGPKKTQTIAIDVSLNKLNKCIKVAYMKMTTPKWKDFKGLRLQWKHRIRLNNVIWRAYYMEFRKTDKRKKTPYCYFAVPDDDTTHSKIEGTVIEGMYWKRRMEAICAQYKKWRTYNRQHAKKKKCCKKASENTCECDVTREKRPQQSQTPQNLSTFDDYFFHEDLDNEFTNSLFDSLNVPFLFPNPREIMQGNNADIMQPGLLSLQPSLEEIMNAVDDDDTNLDALEPTFSMQQPQTSNDHRHINGRSSGYPVNSTANSSSSQIIESNKSYSSNLLMDYNQPTRQSSSLPTNGLMTSNLSQPLYSQAVYETQATPSTSSLNGSPVGSVADMKSAPRSNASSINAVNSLANTLDYVPQFLVSASIGQTAHSNIQTFSSMIGQQNQGQGIRNFVVDQNNQLISPQQWWMNSQQAYNSPEEKALQMLRSPVSQSHNSNGFPGMLLGLNQPNSNIQQQPTYSNPYAFSTSNFKAVQHPTLQQISVHQSLSQEPILSQQQLHLQRQLNLQQQSQNPFQQPNRQQQTPSINQNFIQQQQQAPDLSHYLPQNGGVSTPSASLASLLGPRGNNMNQQRQNVEIKTELPLSNPKMPLNSRQSWGPNKSSSIQTIAGTPISEPLSVQTSQQESYLNGNGKAKQSMITPNELNALVGNKRRNGRKQNQIELSSPIESIPAANNSGNRRTSTRNKRTRSQMLPEIPIASTSTVASNKPHAISQPASVQTQLSYGNDAETLSPLNTPQTDGIVSDESFEERSPSVFSSTTKRSRYSVPCAEAADSTLHPEERKRLLHLNAEKNRREALKDGFDALMQAIPTIEETGIKVTNAVVLNRAGQHIRSLCQKIEDYDKQVADCEKRHELLQKRVSIVQSSLPSNVQQASGGQSSSTVSGQVMQFFERYVRERSSKDQRFYVMASMLKPVVESFSQQVHSDSGDKQQMRNSILNWSENNFKVGRLRPLASQTLIKIATETNLINMNSSGSPTSLQDYITHEVSKLSEYNDSI